MPRKTKTLTISLPPDMMGIAEYITKKEGLTKSKLIQEAIKRYIEEKEWKDIVRYAERQAKRKGITEEQIEDIVDGIRF